MADDVSLRFSSGGFPTRSSAAAGPSGIESEAGDGHEDVAIPGVDGDPFSVASFSVFEESTGGHLALHQSGFTKHVGDGTGAIVSAVIEPGVAATPFVGFVLKTVASGNGELDFGRGLAGSVSHPVMEGGRSFSRSGVANGILGIDLTATGGEEKSDPD